MGATEISLEDFQGTEGGGNGKGGPRALPGSRAACSNRWDGSRQEGGYSFVGEEINS